jgi:hypothetical protein
LFRRGLDSVQKGLDWVVLDRFSLEVAVFSLGIGMTGFISGVIGFGKGKVSGWLGIPQ